MPGDAISSVNVANRPVTQFMFQNLLKINSRYLRFNKLTQDVITQDFLIK